MSNDSLDRFDGHITEDFEECANCGASRSCSDMIYDGYGVEHYCDVQCFDEWADSNRGTVNGFYFDLNCFE